MKVAKDLKVSAKYFYDRVVDSVLYDISEHTGETMSASEISGFEYRKAFGNYPPVTIKITALEPCKKYEFITATSKNTFTTSYNIETTGENSCRVNYTELVTSDGAIQTMNDKMAEAVLSFFKKKRINKLLQAIELSAASDTV